MLETAGSTLQSGCSGTPLYLAARQVHPLPVVAAMPETGRPATLCKASRAGLGKDRGRTFPNPFLTKNMAAWQPDLSTMDEPLGDPEQEQRGLSHGIQNVAPSRRGAG